MVAMYFFAVWSAKWAFNKAWPGAALVIAAIGLLASTSGSPVFSFVAICFSAIGFKAASSLFLPIPQAISMHGSPRPCSRSSTQSATSGALRSCNLWLSATAYRFNHGLFIFIRTRSGVPHSRGGHVPRQRSKSESRAISDSDRANQSALKVSNGIRDRGTLKKLFCPSVKLCRR
jgi:hypothetical protein